jgi:hypothetical protein
VTNHFAEAQALASAYRNPTSKSRPVTLFVTRIFSWEILEFHNLQQIRNAFTLQGVPQTRFLIGYSFPGIDIKLKTRIQRT